MKKYIFLATILLLSALNSAVSAQGYDQVDSMITSRDQQDDVFAICLKDEETGTYKLHFYTQKEVLTMMYEGQEGFTIGEDVPGKFNYVFDGNCVATKKNQEQLGLIMTCYYDDTSRRYFPFSYSKPLEALSKCNCMPIRPSNYDDDSVSHLAITNSNYLEALSKYCGDTYSSEYIGQINSIYKNRLYISQLYAFYYDKRFIINCSKLSDATDEQETEIK